MNFIRPKKYFGQHFLNDREIARQIADTVNVFPHLPVLEVGPGTGVLTQFLLKNCQKLLVVEVDMEAVAYLNVHFPELAGKIITGDFLKLDLTTLFSGQFCLTGNYPYNISSQIFFKLLDYKNRIPCCTGMVQKEVAERIAAPPGSRVYGITSVLLQAWYDIEYLFTVNEQAFNPPPKVKSAVIRLVRNKVEKLDCDEIFFKMVVKTAFNQRRKTLRNSLKTILPPTVDAARPVFSLRPEQLSVTDFVDLSKYITSGK
ncbi:MAG: 16S rRNA (adenine(1518)-N(6)/adenine(1519)-N(6))-dimethyltransferase RsmA [Bacteroidales bacterium]|jgi:16S rRNA (adenine1518-N6/adenine1519-N6)-dimethyltransferase|nr:16S rRNA (adenine(1518)-N(6)/adenine(1519)-N(6))-dimethyltransferase RsmA [Bacteroidales bacterium]